MTNYDWLKPLRERARKLEEETKRIRERSEQLQKKTAKLQEERALKAPSETNKETEQLTMVKRVKFVSVTRTIDDRNGIHYLDAVDEDGQHWEAEMSSRIEKWMVYTKVWRKDPQQPLDL